MANGLNPKEQKLLAQRRTEVETLLTRNFLIGGKEARQLYDVLERIKTRLEPPAASELDEEAERLLAMHRDLPWYADLMKAVA